QTAWRAGLAATKYVGLADSFGPLRCFECRFKELTRAWIVSSSSPSYTTHKVFCALEQLTLPLQMCQVERRTIGHCPVTRFLDRAGPSLAHSIRREPGTSWCRESEVTAATTQKGSV